MGDLGLKTFRAGTRVRDGTLCPATESCVCRTGLQDSGVEVGVHLKKVRDVGSLTQKDGSGREET